MQQAIIATGLYLRGGADGIFGQRTHNALVIYQRTNGMNATGVVDARRLGRWASSSAAAAPAAAPPPLGTRFRRGGRPVVVALQRALISAGIPVPGGADGVRLRRPPAPSCVPAGKGLPATGKVDQATAQALGLPDARADAAPAVTIRLQARPVGGRCCYGDTWHAPAAAAGSTSASTSVPRRALPFAPSSRAGSSRSTATGLARCPGTDQDRARRRHVLLLRPSGGLRHGHRRRHPGDRRPGHRVLGRPATRAIAHLHFEVHPAAARR